MINSLERSEKSLMGRDRIIIRLVVFVMLVSACDNYNSNSRRIAVAKAGEQILYYDQIPNLIMPGMTATDSIAVIQNYVNKWAKREILKLKAIENLTPEFRSEVERQLDEIRTNLLIHRYQQQMISQRLDTLITEEEIENHYAANSSTFILNNNIVKALFIRAPAGTPNLESINSLFRSDNPSDLAQLELISYQFADKFDDFNEEWIPLTYLLAELPVTIDNQEEFLRRNRYFETSDSLFNYYVKIREYQLRSTIAPYEYARNNIISIILNSRKMVFLQELENGVFNEAIRASVFTIYQ